LRTRAALGGTDKEYTSWVAQQARAYTLLARVYDEVCRAGTFLFWGEDAQSELPSLVSAARAAPSAKPKPVAPAGGAGGTTPG
jgi:hypothetical protein